MPPASAILRAVMLEGLHWLWRLPLIRYMAFLTGSINFVNAATGLIIIVLAQELGARPVDIGLIFSIGGIGGVLGSLIGGQGQKRFSFWQGILFSLSVDPPVFPLPALAPGYLLLRGLVPLQYFLRPGYHA